MEKFANASSLSVIHCDDIGVMICFEYTCPFCNRMTTYSGLESYDSYFASSSTDFLPTKVKCPLCGEDVSILFSE